MNDSNDLNDSDKYSQSYSSNIKKLNDPELIKIKKSLELKHSKRNVSNSIDEILDSELNNKFSLNINEILNKNKDEPLLQEDLSDSQRLNTIDEEANNIQMTGGFTKDTIKKQEKNQEQVVTEQNDIAIKNEWTPLNTDSSYLDNTNNPRTKRNINSHSELYEYYINTESNNNTSELLQRTNTILNNSIDPVKPVSSLYLNDIANNNQVVSNIPTFRAHTDAKKENADFIDESSIEFGLNYNYSNHYIMHRIKKDIRKEYDRKDNVMNEPKKKKNNNILFPEQIYTNNYDKFEVDVTPYYKSISMNKLTIDDIIGESKSNKNTSTIDSYHKIKMKEYEIDNNDDINITKQKLPFTPEIAFQNEMIQKRNAKEIKELYNETFKKLNYKGNEYSKYNNKQELESKNHCEVKPNELYRKKIIKVNK